MYGMIHRALRELVIEQRGSAAWEMIVVDAGVEPLHMISAVVHDDSITMQIMDSAARALDLDMAEGLEAFGKSWISFVAKGSYGAFLDFLGDDLFSFVGNLDRMHHSITIAMPSARMPSFSVIEAGSGFMTLLYRSDREGLEPFVCGLFKGLFDRFGLTGAVRCMGERSEGILFELTFSGDDPPLAPEG